MTSSSAKKRTHGRKTCVVVSRSNSRTFFGTAEDSSLLNARTMMIGTSTLGTSPMTRASPPVTTFSGLHQNQL